MHGSTGAPPATWQGPDDRREISQQPIHPTASHTEIRTPPLANNDEPSIGRFADALIDTQARVISDGLASYNRRTLKDRAHAMTVQTKAEKAIRDAQQQCHWAISNLKRWWLGTHHGAISDKHAQAYLDEFTFRYNRRKTQGVGRLVARALQSLAATPPTTMRQLVQGYAPHPAEPGG